MVKWYHIIIILNLFDHILYEEATPTFMSSNTQFGSQKSMPTPFDKFRGSKTLLTPATSCLKKFPFKKKSMLFAGAYILQK